jgi:hypothetical protein
MLDLSLDGDSDEITLDPDNLLTNQGFSTLLSVWPTMIARLVDSDDAREDTSTFPDDTLGGL